MTVVIRPALTGLSRAALSRELRASHGVPALLAKPDSNPKVAKNMKQGVLTAPLHLAPADLSGYEVCPMATLGCRKACLHTAGNPAAMAGKNKARIARTKAYMEARELFMALLIRELEALQAKADKLGLIAGCRLNATSDIPWERVAIEWNGVRFANIMAMFPRMSFYDYTKRPNRKNIPANYHLTFSLAEGNDFFAEQALQNGLNVAVVFATKRGKALPEAFMGRPVIDGDETDYRPADERGVIVGLRAKGDAIGDTSGFVRAA